MGVRQNFSKVGGVLVSKLFGELSASLGVEGCAHLASGDVAVDFVAAPTAQDLIDAQAVIDAHDPTDTAQEEADAAEVRFAITKADFIRARDLILPLYDTVPEATRQSLIDNLTSAATFRALDEDEFRNTVAVLLAVLISAADISWRR